uniref:Receptor-like serine/threonine-protein kinase n=1 Tax=Davidia involucrata TaxID=16924 RepID=A0A5B7C1T6_DAVIN
MAATLILPWFFVLFSTLLHVSHAQIPPNISLGSNIIAGSNLSWRSLSGDFAFGFYPVSTGLYLVGIWFDKIQERALVWSPNRDSPAQRGSEIRLTFDGQLRLTYSNGSVQTIYSGAAASLGFMQNDGNFVLRDSNSGVIWQSFDSPTDTLLPGQVLVRGKKLFSNTNGTVDFSTGNFMLEMQFDGNLVLSAYHFSDPGYWYTATSNNVSLVFNQTSAFMYLVNDTRDNIYALTKNVTTPVGDYYHRATIDEYGNFQQYVFHKSNGSSWRSVWKAISEPCIVNSVCGVNGFCTSPDNETVTCNCLQGYLPLDPNSPSKGCRPETVLNYCEDPSARNFTVEVIDDADFPFQGFADLSRVRNVDVEGCKKALMDDCYTIAASLDKSTCIKKRMPLLNARKSNSTTGIKALIKVPIKIPNSGLPDGYKKKNSNTRAHLKAGLLTSGIFAFLFGAIALYYHPAARRLIRRRQFPNPTPIGINFREFTYQELREATNGFSKTLGRGSSAKVYSGVLNLNDIQIEIAVKKLEHVVEQGEKGFMTELKIIGRTHHKNLVRLLGFCIEDDHRLLVYELMKNGALSDFLFKDGERPSWSQRSEMALGIARGLLYLHEECESQIIHCDIKPQNVLLDVNYTAKIADFGFSKLMNKDQTRTKTGARGTMGYMAPEWLRNAPITTKVDIYSFGVMLLEISCARRHIELSRVEEESEEEDLILTNWALSCVRSGKLEKLVRHDSEVLSDFKRFERIVMVGLWCVHPDAILRPSMKKVTQMLEGTMEVEIPPLVYHQ